MSEFITVEGDKLGRTWLAKGSDIHFGRYIKGRARIAHDAGFNGLCATCVHQARLIDEISCSKLPLRYDDEDIADGVIGQYPPGDWSEEMPPVMIRCKTRKTQR